MWRLQFLLMRLSFPGEGQGGERIPSRLHAQHGTRCGTWSHNPETVTGAKISHLTDWATWVPPNIFNNNENILVPSLCGKAKKGVKRKPKGKDGCVDTVGQKSHLPITNLGQWETGGQSWADKFLSLPWDHFELLWAHRSHLLTYCWVLLIDHKAAQQLITRGQDKNPQKLTPTLQHGHSNGTLAPTPPVLTAKNWIYKSRKR